MFFLVARVGAVWVACGVGLVSAAGADDFSSNLFSDIG